MIAQSYGGSAETRFVVPEGWSLDSVKSSNRRGGSPDKMRFCLFPEATGDILGGQKPSFMNTTAKKTWTKPNMEAVLIFFECTCYSGAQ